MCNLGKAIELNGVRKGEKQSNENRLHKDIVTANHFQPSTGE